MSLDMGLISYDINNTNQYADSSETSPICQYILVIRLQSLFTSASAVRVVHALVASRLLTFET